MVVLSHGFMFQANGFTLWFYLMVLCFRPVVLAYNIPGVRDLVLSREQVVGIYNGTIRYWNDSSLQVRGFLKILIAIFVSR